MARIIRVYVSSTYEDLKDYREAVRKELTLLNQELDGAATVVVVGMEGYPPSDERPIQKCVNDVSACDIYLGIIGFRYGWVSGDKVLNPNGIAVTEIEYRAAASKPRLLLLADVTRANDLLAAAGRDFGNSPKDVQRLRNEWDADRLRGLFHDPFSCATKAADGLRNWLRSQGLLAGQASEATPPAPKIRIGGTPPFQFIGKRFKDRQETLAKLMEKIADPAIRVVFVEGRGGIGKSQCALALCDRIHEPLQGSGSRHAKPTATAIEMGITGVVYHSFRESTGALAQSDEVRRKIAFNRDEFLGHFLAAVPEVEAERFRTWQRGAAAAGEGEVFRQLFRAAAEGHVVVLLDNFEDALEESGPNKGQLRNESLRALFDALLAGCQNVTVLITTRRPMSFASHVLAAVHQPKALDKLPPNDCRDLLRELDEEKDGRAKLRDADEATLTALAEACERVPRALEHAFALLLRTRTLKPAALTAQLRDRAGDGHKEVTERLLKDVWATAHPEELEVAKALAILGRPATVGDVAAMLRDRPGLAVDKCLNALADAALAAFDDANETFSLHETDRRHLLATILPDDAKMLHRAAAAAAKSRRCPAEKVTADFGIDVWEEQFQHLLDAGDPRAAWNAIRPLVPDSAWERMFFRQALRWLEAILAVADKALRRDVLPSMCSLLLAVSDCRALLPFGVELEQAVKGQGDWRLALALNYQASAHKGLANYAAAEPLYRRALAIEEKAYGPDHPHVAASLNNFAGLLRDTNRHREAEPLSRRALAIHEEAYGPHHPDVATCLSNLANLLFATTRHREAEPLYRRSLAIREKAYGPEHPEVATGLNNLAALLAVTNRHREAEPLVRRALAIREKAHGPDHPDVGTSLNNLMGLVSDTNRHREAEPLCRRALAIYEKAYGPEHPNVATHKVNLAHLLAETGRGAKAVPLLEQALAAHVHALDKRHWWRIAAALLSRNEPGDAARALDEARRAVEILSTSPSLDHRRVSSTLRTRAAAERANGLGAEAVASLRESVRILEALEVVPLKDTADAFAELAEALAAIGDAAGADAARAKSADYRRRYDEQEAAAAEAFPLPPLPEWVEELLRGT